MEIRLSAIGLWQVRDFVAISGTSLTQAGIEATADDGPKVRGRIVDRLSEKAAEEAFALGLDDRGHARVRREWRSALADDPQARPVGQVLRDAFEAVEIDRLHSQSADRLDQRVAGLESNS